MKERKTSLLKRLAAVVLCICMITVTFGTAVFAEKGTASTTDDLFLTMEDFTGLGATVGESFNSATLKTLSGGMMSGNNVGYYIVNEDGSFTAKREAGGGATQTTNIDFGEIIDWETCGGKIVANFAIEPPAMSLGEGKEDNGGYGNPSIAFYGKDADGNISGSVTAIQFNTAGLHEKINSNPASSQFDEKNDIDYDEDGLYEFRIELSKAYGYVYDKSTVEEPFWNVKVYSEESGREGQHLYYMPAAVTNNLTVGGNMKLANVAGIRLSMYTNGAGSKVLDSAITVHDVNVSIERFKATGASNRIFCENGSAVVTFNNDVDETTLGGITMADSNGTSVPVTVSALGNKAIVTAGATLTDGVKYTINIPKTVKSADGYVLATTQSYEVTADYIAYTEDFSDWTLGNLTAGEVSQYSNGLVSVTSGTRSAYTVNENTVGTENFNSFKISGVTDAYIKFPKHINYATVGEKITTRLKLKQNVENQNYGDVYWWKDNGDGTKTKTRAILINKNGTLSRPTGSSSSYSGGNGALYDVDGDGWVDLKFVLEKEYSGSYWCWKSTVYHEENGNETQIYWNKYYTGEETGSYKLTELDGVGFSMSNANGSLEVADVRTEFDRIKSTSCSTSVLYDEGSASIIFNRDLISTTTTENTTVNNITVTDEDGTTVSYAPTVVGNTVVLKFGQLIAGETYTVNIPATVQTADLECVLPATYTFVATDITTDVDFSTWTGVTKVDTTTAVNGYDESAWFDQAKLEELSNGAMTGNGKTKYQLNTDGSLSAYLPFNNGTSGSIRMPFGKTITSTDPDKKITFTLKVKSESIIEKYTDAETGDVTYGAATTSEKGNGPQIYVRGTDGNGAATRVAAMNMGYTTGKITRPTGLGNDFVDAVAYLTEYGMVDGYYNLRVEIDNEPYAGKDNNYIWTVRVYDNITDYLLFKRYITTDTLSTITGVEVGTEMYGSVQSYLMGRVTIKDPKVVLSDVESECTDVVYYNNGKIYVTFNRMIDESTIGNITVTKADGTAIEGATITPTISENRVTLSVNGILEKGDYIVTVPSTVLSKGGEAAKAKTFNVKAGNVIMQQSFENLEAGKVYLPETIDNVNALIGSTLKQPITNSVHEGTNYKVVDGALQVDHTDIGGVYDEGIQFYLPNAVSSGSYAAEYVITPNTTNGGTKTLGAQIVVTSTGLTRAAASNWSGAKGTSYAEPVLKTDANGDWHIKVVASKADTSSNWMYAVHDLNSDTPYYPVAFSQGGTGSISSMDLKVSRDAAARSTDADAYFVVKSVKLYEEENPGAAYAGPLSSSTVATFTKSGNVVTWAGTLYGRKVNGEFPKVLLCAYDTDGELLGVKVHEMTTERAAATITLTLPEGVTATTAKMMIIDNYDNVTPLIDAVQK